MLRFRNPSFEGELQPLACTRAALRLSFVEAAKSRSAFFRDEWVPVPRPRVTHNSFSTPSWIRAPFVVQESLPEESDSQQVQLAEWKTAFRAIEEHLTLAVFGMLPNVTWARILCSVFARLRHQDCLLAFLLFFLSSPPTQRSSHTCVCLPPLAGGQCREDDGRF